MTNTPRSRAGGALIAYFYSGWAFLIPYLLTYLLYLWQKWPANSFAPSAFGNGGYIPALLHVYWALHAIHVTLAGLALRSWWKNGLKGQAIGIDEVAKPQTTFDRLWSTLPWLLLALIFTIPGVYLEWPADPWEHFRRITEWSIHPTIGAHSAGYKSFYFFAFSLYELAPNLDHFTRLSSYSTGISLLLSWQYYRLARAVDLDQRWALLFVLVNVGTFGNVCFSFYKYYGLSSTMYSQLGAVALTRIALKIAKAPQFSLHSFFRRSQLSTLSTQLVTAACLLTLIAFNHVQGLGIVGLSVGSIIIWRLLKWNRSAGWWLFCAATILSVATILWWPRSPAVDAVYRPGGWLNAWYGFNFFAWPSPAADRTLQILGLFGTINFIAGAILIKKNQVVGWLTAGPLIILCFPGVGILFANSVAADHPGEIITFPRLLLSIPFGLAITSLTQQISRAATVLIEHPIKLLRARVLIFGTRPRLGFSALVLCLGAAMLIPPNALFSNRFWNFLARTPDDLALIQVWRGVASFKKLVASTTKTDVIAMSQTGYILEVQNAGHIFVSYRLYARSGRSPIDDLIALDEFLTYFEAKHATHALLLDPKFFFSSTSTAAFCSMHWPPQEATLATAGTPELLALSKKMSLGQKSEADGYFILTAPEGKIRADTPLQ